MAESPSRRLARPLRGDLADAYDVVAEEIATVPGDSAVEIVVEAAREAAAEAWDGEGELREAFVDLLVTLAIEQAAREADRG